MPGRSSVLAGVGLLVVLAGGGTAAVLLRERPAPAPVITAPSLTEVAVSRMDLTDSRLFAGTLGFGDARVLKGTGTGVVTRLPAVGAKVTRGAELYRVDDQPVIVFYGDTPMFRTIDKAGLEGSDVRQLRRNLIELGYRTGTAKDDSVSDTALIDALRRWQQKLGVTGPGALRPGQIIVVTGPGQVSNLAAEPGAPADGPIVEVTSTVRVVTIPMSSTDAAGVKQGAVVSIQLPDGREVPGKVSAIGRTVIADPAEAGGPPQLTVTVTPDRADDVAALDSAPVQVRFTTAAREQVLAVPVGALVALREGGYAVQTPAGALIAVETGVFAGGMVEVTGAGIDAGTTVVTTP